MLEGPGQEQTRIELHLLQGVKSGKIAGIPGSAVELFTTDVDPDEVLSGQGFAAIVVCVTFAVIFEDVTRTSGFNFEIGIGIATKALELLVLGRVELVVAAIFDTEVVFRSSALLAKLGIANGALEFPAILLFTRVFNGKVHVARASLNI